MWCARRRARTCATRSARRTLWVTDRIAESKDIPEDLDEFYKEKYLR